MNYKFEMTSYCKGCSNAEMKVEQTNMFADNTTVSSEYVITCKHEAACERMHNSVDAGKIIKMVKDMYSAPRF